jgi:hypothetical protein
MALPEHGAFAGIGAFTQLVRDALETAALDGWNEMIWCDSTFEDWPLRERSVVDSLNQWAQRGRKLTLLAHRFDAMQRLHPRFVEWRVRWDHIVECRICRDIGANEVPSAIWSPHWAMRRLDPLRCTGVTGVEPRVRLLLREELDERKRQSGPGFPASVLGL